MRALALSLALVAAGFATDGVRADDDHDFEVTFTILQEGLQTDPPPIIPGLTDTKTIGGGTIVFDKLPFPGKVRVGQLKSFELKQTDFIEDSVQHVLTFEGTDKFFQLRFGTDGNSIIKKLGLRLARWDDRDDHECVGVKGSLTLLDAALDNFDGMKFSGPFRNAKQRKAKGCNLAPILRRSFASTPSANLAVVIHEPVEVPVPA